jgi:hypothetical protein
MKLLSALGLVKEYRSPHDYAKLKSFFKSRIGFTFKKGVIDDDQIDLYFFYDLHYTKMGMDRAPTCQLSAINKLEEDGSTLIKIQFAGYYLIAEAIFCLLISAFTYFNGIEENFGVLLLTACIPFSLFVFFNSFHVSSQYEFLIKDLEQLK